MNLISQDYLMHHGVKGMKWGVRRAEQKRTKIINKYNRIIDTNLQLGNSRKADLQDYKKKRQKVISMENCPRSGVDQCQQVVQVYSI